MLDAKGLAARRLAEEAKGLRADITRLSRGPFVDLVVLLVQAARQGFDVTALAAYAKKNPDRMMQAITQAVRAAGYRDGLELTGNLEVDVLRLSDAEVDARVEAILVRRLAGRPCTPALVLDESAEGTVPSGLTDGDHSL